MDDPPGLLERAGDVILDFLAELGTCLECLRCADPDDDPIDRLANIDAFQPLLHAALECHELWASIADSGWWDDRSGRLIAYGLVRSYVVIEQVLKRAGFHIQFESVVYDPRRRDCLYLDDESLVELDKSLKRVDVGMMAVRSRVRPDIVDRLLEACTGWDDVRAEIAERGGATARSSPPRQPWARPSATASTGG